MPDETERRSSFTRAAFSASRRAHDGVHSVEQRFSRHDFMQTNATASTA